MDRDRFDQLALRFAAAQSRRQALRLLAAGLLGTAALARSPRPAAAALCPTRMPRPDYTPTANGCGPDGYDWFVPDSWKKANFTPACKGHDVCYGTCHSDRDECDYAFLDGMKQACRRAYGGTGKRARRLRGKCIDRAHQYYTAVSDYGQEAWEDAQAEACVCCDTVPCQPGEEQDPKTCGCSCPGAAGSCAKHEVCRDGACVAVCPSGSGGVHNGSFVACEVDGGVQCHCNACGTTCPRGEACCSVGCRYVVTTCADHGH